MANRIRRTKQQVANDLEKKLTKVKKDMKEEARKAESHKAIIIGKALQGRANGGNANAKRELDEILAGLTRDQDRRAFGLDLLPGQGPDAAPAAQPPAQPAAKPSAADLSGRINRAVDAWNASPTPELQAEMVAAIIEFEKQTDKLFAGIPAEARRGFGMGDRPGERI